MPQEFDDNRCWIEDSTTYQEILEIGEARGIERAMERGRLIEARIVILRVGTKRFGPPDAKAFESLQAITDIERLRATLDRLFDSGMNSWAKLRLASE